jgi:WD40 repeat protein
MVHDFPDVRGGGVRGVDFSPDGTRLAISRSNTTVSVYDLRRSVLCARQRQALGHWRRTVWHALWRGAAAQLSDGARRVWCPHDELPRDVVERCVQLLRGYIPPFHLLHGDVMGPLTERF